MGASDFLGDMDIDSAREERDNRVNPPEYAPGQDEDYFEDDLFGNSDSGGELSLGMGGMDTGGLGSTGSFDGFAGQSLGMNNLGMQAQPQQPQATAEDKMFDAAVSAGKGIVAFTKDLVLSVKEVTPKFWTVWGSNTFVVSLSVAAVGIILSLFKIKPIGVDFIVGGLLSAGTGSLVLMLNIDKAKNLTSYFKDGTPIPDSNVIRGTNNAIASGNNDFNAGEQDFMADDVFGDSGFSDTSEGGDFGNDGFGDFDSANGFGDFREDDGFGDFSSSAGFDDFANSDNDDFGDFDDFEDEYEDVDSDIGSEDDFFSDVSSDTNSGGAVSLENAINAIDTATVPDKGMYTRQYLFDMLDRVLEHITPNFSDMTEIDRDSNTFIGCEHRLREAATATGVREENLPELLKLEENLFIIKFTCTRPAGFKPEDVAVELANIFAHSGDTFNPKVYATSERIASKCIITVYTGETKMVSLKDTYTKCKDFVLNTKNYIPVVLGINPMGKTITYDFKKLESVLITGMPRGGKSWFIQAVLLQMCAFVPPSELNIYICDPKDGISDFKSFALPHVKRFVSGDDNIVNTLRSVVKDLAPKRKRIIGDAGFVNIWDFKERNPDVHMPVIYIVIDEVVTLAERMEKETKKEFQGLLVELISQLPALGIRAFLIPHVVKNDIIAKTATDLIPCRISILGDAAHIESTTGTKAKDFSYKLTNVGDMAAKIPAISSETMFIHGLVLTDSNPKNNDLFTYISKLWSRLEPEEFSNSVAGNSSIISANQSALNSLDLDDVSDVSVDATDTDEINNVLTDNQTVNIPRVSASASREILNPQPTRLSSQNNQSGSVVNAQVTNNTLDDDFDPLADDEDDFDFLN